MFNSNQAPQQHIQQLYQSKQPMQQLPQQNFQSIQPQNAQNYGNPALSNMNNILQQQFMPNMPNIQSLQPNMQNMGVNPVALGMPMNNLRYPSNMPQQQIQNKVVNNPNQTQSIHQRPIQNNVGNLSSPQLKNQNIPFKTEASPIVANANLQNTSAPQYTPEQIKQLINVNLY
ncbi:hypothetical protein PIROE2DRAFT_58670 [Piromyces sp. E2]|nr:hypothetical protein PIROE2DRAFT_58670 [Piromyces sp. E2]|eukprot:OUM67633.1 hypothetical protein PIROE2DRAFT_58670 [Piromyces sp. E2]